MRPIGLPSSRTIQSSRWAVAGERSRLVGRSVRAMARRDYAGVAQRKAQGQPPTPGLTHRPMPPTARQNDATGLCPKNRGARARMKYIHDLGGPSPRLTRRETRLSRPAFAAFQAAAAAPMKRPPGYEPGGLGTHDALLGGQLPRPRISSSRSSWRSTESSTRSHSTHNTGPIGNRTHRRRPQIRPRTRAVRPTRPRV